MGVAEEMVSDEVGMIGIEYRSCFFLRRGIRVHARSTFEKSERPLNHKHDKETENYHEIRGSFCACKDEMIHVIYCAADIIDVTIYLGLPGMYCGSPLSCQKSESRCININQNRSSRSVAVLRLMCRFPLPVGVGVCMRSVSAKLCAVSHAGKCFIR